ncbi:ribonuclease Z [Aspergillus undulatus]|uniref:ribonuclease Z n=1 Tax=Aspergillus undulatus TaxID=1810928 RepID=UPI003CCDD1F6
MKFYYQIVTTPTADTPGTTVLLHFPNKRYLFGQISEGLQRACTENGTKLTNISDIFISGRMGWDTTGGLIGMILTKADGVASSIAAQENFEREKEERRQKLPGGQQTKEKGKAANADQEVLLTDLAVHGGRNLTHTLATARRFVFRKGLPVYTKEYDAKSTSRQQRTDFSDPFEEPTWSDENTKVWVMPVSPSLISPRSQSPRKRSLDEYREDTTGLVKVDQQSQDQLTRQSVVSSMFNSDWSLDALEETRLADVKMPAYIFVRNPETKDLEKYTGPLPGGDEPVPEIKVLVRKPWPGVSVSKIPTTTKNEESLCYIVKNHDLRGRFDNQKAQALKVKRGPDYSALTNGKNVMSEDGNVVTPDMVLGPPKRGKGLAVLDLPTSKYVESLLNRPEWKSPSVTENLEAFLWILGPGVGDHPRLREFVASFPDSKHIVSSTDYCPNYLAMQSVAGSNIRMARLRSQNYAIPLYDDKAARSPQSPFEPAEPGLIVTMEPEFKLDTSQVVPRFDAVSVLNQMPHSAEQRAMVISRRLRRSLHQDKLQKWLEDTCGADAEIITLGTGSSSPSKYRNVSSTLVHVPDQGYYLLDCGEGTLGQLKRLFNPEQLHEVLQNLRLIWISHLHADHHLGTVSVIKAWYRENYPDGVSQSDYIEDNLHKILEEKRLFLVSDSMMVEWLEEYASVEDFGFSKLTPLTANPYMEEDRVRTSFNYRHCRADGSYPRREVAHLKPAQTELWMHKRGSSLSVLLRKATGLEDLLTTYVAHCRGAMAVSLVFPNGFKVSFSGDCRPSPSFAAIGKHSTVLIHEATFSDDMAGSAVAKKHSTVGEAINIGHQMQARAILLTHFSQRYQKILSFDAAQASSKDTETPKEAPPPPLEESTDNPVDNDAQEDLASKSPKTLITTEPTESPQPVVPVVAAFDHMRVRVGDMLDLEAFTPATEKLFEIIERAAAREARKWREERSEQLRANNRLKKQLKNLASKAEKKANVDGKEKEGEGKDISPSDDASPPDDSNNSRWPPLSVWEAPDSESGWSSSGSESDRNN